MNKTEQCKAQALRARILELEMIKDAQELQVSPWAKLDIDRLIKEVERLMKVLEVIARNPVGDNKPKEPFSSTSYVAWFVINLAREALEDKEVEA